MKYVKIKKKMFVNLRNLNCIVMGKYIVYILSEVYYFNSNLTYLAQNTSTKIFLLVLSLYTLHYLNRFHFLFENITE